MNVPDGNMLINLDMLGALVLDRVDGEVDGAKVVAVDQSGPQEGTVQLHMQLTKPTRICHAVGHGAVLRLSARTRDGVLMLRGPGDEVVTQEYYTAQSGLVSIRTVGLVSISVDDEVRRRGMAKKQVVVEDALEVPKDALHSHEMGLTGGRACGGTPAGPRRQCGAW
jgi:hypothetical protein